MLSAIKDFPVSQRWLVTESVQLKFMLQLTALSLSDVSYTSNSKQLVATMLGRAYSGEDTSKVGAESYHSPHQTADLHSTRCPDIQFQEATDSWSIVAD